MTLGFPDYGHGPVDGDEIEAMFKEYETRTQLENRDRTLAIVGGAGLEELLGKLILALMIDGKVAENTLNHTFSSFYSRIQIAYCFGLISPDEYTDLHTIRKIRNYFAHSTSGSSFRDPQVIDLCRDLQIPKQRPDLFNRLSPAEIFESTAFVLSENIEDRASMARQQKCSVPDEIDSERWQEFF